MAIKLIDLTCEYRRNPVGVDARTPALGWRLAAEERGVVQSAYQIRVAADADACLSSGAVLFDTGKIASAQSLHIPYAGPELVSRRRYYWQARIWDQEDVPSEWSEPAHWEMGLLDPSEWNAEWIEAAPEAGAHALLRREFTLRGAVRRARLYATAHGLYQLYLNGRRVGDHELAPGWTSYNKRLQYQTYDVTDLLESSNAIGAMLSEGWYCGLLLWNDQGKHYGERPGFLAQLEIDYADGSRELIVSDGRWRSSSGPVVDAGIYLGEIYDARREQHGWCEYGFNDQEWLGVKLAEGAKDVLVAQAGPPVRKMQELAPEIVGRIGDKHILDMGQNMVGWVRLRVEGPRGAKVVLRHAEALDPDGDLYLGNLRDAAQLIEYTLKGGGVEIYEPHFTFMGFRYVSVEGWPGELKSGDIAGVVVHSDIERTGSFETSSRLLNKLQQAIWWGQRGNFIDVPTDCPQRNERMGWTGDAQVFAPTAAFNADVAAFFTKWLGDLSADQRQDGNVPFVVPDVWGVVNPKRFADAPEEIRNRPPFQAAGGAGWGDAAVMVPWSLYLAYGDRRFLRRQYESMKRWVSYQRSRAGDDLIWRGDFHFGDWLDFGSTSSHRFGSTDHDLIATAFFAHSSDLLSRAAAALGESRDQKRYETQFRSIRAAFQENFIRADGSIGEGTQTPYVLALQFGLIDDARRAAAAKRLADNVRERGHLTTGFLGTPWLLFALSDNGYLELAYDLLNRREFPSWLYPITRGATTIWERWDGIRPDGSFQDEKMNSFNHYAYGAVGDWMYKTVAGINIDPQAPGYKHVVFRPQPGGGLTQAAARHCGPYGEVACEWRIEGERFSMRVETPPNAIATVHLPAIDRQSVTESGRALEAGVNGVARFRDADGDLVVEVGSGRFDFSARRLASA